jgi:hypothetical protein
MQYPVKCPLLATQWRAKISGVSPVTDLLDPAKASRRPTEQRANPVKRRELKKAAREADFLFV